jgi:endonuclease-3 related protein
MRSSRSRIRIIYHVLLAAYGPQGWWPGRGPLETIVGAVLTQNTSWRNVEQALEALRTSGALSDHGALGGLAREELERLVRPAGFGRRKAETLRRLLALVPRGPGGLCEWLSTDRDELRRSLLDVGGIGPETADSILLYAAGRAVFVVDAYARRLVGRHGLEHAGAPYERLRHAFEDALPPSVRVMNEYHALIVRLGKAHCRSKPLCSGCPLSWDLPAGTAEG